MKTVYGEISNDYGIVVLTDDVLKRIADLRAMLATYSANMRENAVWRESISVEINYGKYDLQDNTSEDGPVLVYGNRAQDDKRRRVQYHVIINVYPGGSAIETYGWDSSVSLLNYSDTVESIPEVYFSDAFIRNYAHFVVNPDSCFCDCVKEIYDDMPEAHRKLLEEPTQKYIKDNDLVEDEEKYKALVAVENRRTACQKTVHDVLQKTGYAIKIGLDFHGVIDDVPYYFSRLSHQVKEAGGEVHILTGSKDTEELRSKLIELDIPFTKLFSIASYHEGIGTHVWHDERGPWMDKEIWDKSKAEYCKREGIQVHIDDSDTYGQHFGPETTYVYYNTQKDK